MRKRQAGKMVGEGYRPKIWVTDKDRKKYPTKYYGGHIVPEESEDDPDIDIGLLMVRVLAVGIAAVGLIGFGMLIL